MMILEPASWINIAVKDSLYVLTNFHFCPNNCGRKYKRKCHLKRHLKFECGVGRQFHCVICAKSFSRKSTLKTHLGMVHAMLMME